MTTQQSDDPNNPVVHVDTEALRRAVAESRAPSLWVQDGQDAVLALCDEVESLRGALDTALGLAERWNEPSQTPGHSYLEDCADELLQALSPIVLPVIEAEGVVSWPDHDEGRLRATPDAPADPPEGDDWGLPHGSSA